MGLSYTCYTRSLLVRPNSLDGGARSLLVTPKTVDCKMMAVFQICAVLLIISEGIALMLICVLTGGLVFLDCVDMMHGTPRGQIIMDYLTDAVLRHDETINGRYSYGLFLE